MWAAALSADYCQAIINQAVKIEPKEGRIGFGDSNRTDRGLRRSVVRWIPTGDREGWAHLLDRLDWYFRFANDQAFGFDLTRNFEVQFTEYDASEEGHYDWHEDLSWCDTKPSQRKLSLVVQLSDPADYEGGVLELANDAMRDADLEKLKQRGTVVVFPAFNRHRVSPVTLGKRYSLVTWMQGPAFR